MSPKSHLQHIFYYTSNGTNSNYSEDYDDNNGAKSMRLPRFGYTGMMMLAKAEVKDPAPLGSWIRGSLLGLRLITQYLELALTEEIEAAFVCEIFLHLQLFFAPTYAICITLLAHRTMLLLSFAYESLQLESW